MFANYHPYEFVSVYEQTDEPEKYCSIVVRNNVAASLHSFLARPSGVKVSTPRSESEGTQRFRVDCSKGTLRFLLRKWVGAWRDARDNYPPVDVVRVRRKETADIEDILGKNVRAVRRNGSEIIGKVVEVGGDFSERLCLARIMNPTDRSKDFYVSFDEVREFEVLS